MHKNKKRTAREIKVDKDLVTNKNISIKIGTTQRKNNPETIYIFASFWVQPKQQYITLESNQVKRILNKEFNKIYDSSLKEILENSTLFVSEKDTIYIKNIPDNVNYNGKPNFISIEMYLHTCNLMSKKKVPLCHKKDKTLFNEALKLGNIIGNSDVLNQNSIFKISKTSSL